MTISVDFVKFQIVGLCPFFNVVKFSFTRLNGNSLGTVYYMNDDSGSSTIIQQIAEQKDSGIHLTDDLKPNIQGVKSAAKARSITGMVNRKRDLTNKISCSYMTNTCSVWKRRKGQRHK